MDARIDEKWAEILQYAHEHATGEGMHKGYRWLQDAFEDYFEDHEQRVEKGTMPSFGGASFSDYNRTVFAAQIARSLSVTTRMAMKVHVSLMTNLKL